VDGRPFTDGEKLRTVQRNERAKAYANGAKLKTNRKETQREEVRTRLGRLEERISSAAQLNVSREEYMLSGERGFIEAEEGTLERTGKVTQKDVSHSVATQAGAQVYNLDLNELGPYRVDWTSNGRFLLLSGNKGHVAVMNAQQPKLVTELHLRETVRDACFLHNESLIAVAQQKSLFLYDRDGVELHCLRQHVEPTRLCFLPYHFLLAVASTTGYLK
jgi:U3 small nucleolar RNA-associated protein 7